MPRKNVVKQFSDESYYHVFSRGVFHQDIFTTERDYATFLGLFKKHLSNEQVYDITRRPVPHLINKVELLAYCLMPNHFHLLVYNKTSDGLTLLMRSVLTAYSMYFNKIHKRRGTLFESSYKASQILDDAYLWHISRYIHLNPQDLGKDYSNYPYSSCGYYIGKKKAEWIRPERILGMYADENSSYIQFVNDYKSMRAELQQIKHELADS